MPTYEYNKEYAKKYLGKLDEIRIRLPKGEKDTIKAHAESMGESTNAFITRAIYQTMQKDRGE